MYTLSRWSLCIQDGQDQSNFSSNSELEFEMLGWNLGVMDRFYTDLKKKLDWSGPMYSMCSVQT